MGSGKSEAARILRELGYTVQDADAIAKHLLESDGIKPSLIRLFGPDILKDSGEIDKAYMAFRIFNDPTEKEKVEQLVHPLVYAQLRQNACMTSPHELIFSEVPLLFESHGQNGFDATLLITCDETVAKERLVKIRGFKLEDVEARLKNQMSVEAKIKLADTVIENNGSTQELKQKMLQYLQTLQTGTL